MDSFTRDGLTFDVIDSGPSDGDVVVLLHGFPQTATSWAKVSARLNAEGFRTVAPTQRGYSPGARPKGRRAYRIEELVADASALIDAIGRGRVHLVGHDWGGAVAWSLAASRPDQVKTYTSVSVPHPAAFIKSMTRSPQLLRSWYMLAFQIPWVPEFGARRAPHVFEATLARMGMTPEETATARREVIDSGAFTGGLNWYRALPFSGPKELSQRVRVPTTHVWSSGDSALDRRGAELTRDLVAADYELRILSGDHWIPDHQPDRLAEIILDRVRSVDAG